MDIRIYKKNILKIDDFEFRCSIGLNGVTQKKVEGDLCTPKGVFKLMNLYYRTDRNQILDCKLNKIKIKKDMVWCDDPINKRYNKLSKLSKKIKSEKLFRNDYRYDLLIELNHNVKCKPFMGSAIFLHLTKNYKSTRGCIALSKKDFKIMLRLLTKDNYIYIP